MPSPGSQLSLSTATSRKAAFSVPSFLVPSLQSTNRTNTSRPRISSPSAPSASAIPPTPHLFTSTSASPTSSRDTIFALATSPGRSGIAIIRISGPLSTHLYFSLTLTSLLRPYTRLPPSHRLVLRNIHHPHTRELLDSSAGLIFFPANASFTHDPTLELHIHGGVATVRDVLSALGDVEGLRMAEPGEFTRRAWESGRLNLTEVEGLSELIDAETSVQRRVALGGVAGRQTQRYEAIRERILAARVAVEAVIDFGEDGVEQDTLTSARGSVNDLVTLLRDELGEEKVGGKRHVGEILTNGIRLAIYGPPNAGKSSLLNALADRNAAIVSAIPGTTRDVLELNLDLNGYKVIVYDTAGIRHQVGNEIERIGIDRARKVVEQADLALLVLPATQPLDDAMVLRPQAYTEDDQDLVFFNKSDLASPDLPSNAKVRYWTGSLLTNTSLGQLVGGLAQLISRKYELSTTEAPLITQSRHRVLLRQCLRHVEEFQRLVDGEEVDLVLAAEELRCAAREIGKVTGRDVSVDEILGSIFSTFALASEQCTRRSRSDDGV